MNDEGIYGEEDEDYEDGEQAPTAKTFSYKDLVRECVHLRFLCVKSIRGCGGYCHTDPRSVAKEGTNGD